MRGAADDHARRRLLGGDHQLVEVGVALLHAVAGGLVVRLRGGEPTAHGLLVWSARWRGASSSEREMEGECLAHSNLPEAQRAEVDVTARCSLQDSVAHGGFDADSESAVGGASAGGGQRKLVALEQAGATAVQRQDTPKARGSERRFVAGRCP